MKSLKKTLKIILICAVIITVLYGGYALWFKFTKVNTESFIASDFLFLFQTKELFSLFNKLDESNLLSTIFYNKEMKDVYKVMIDLRMQMQKSKKSIAGFLNMPATFVMDKNKRMIIIIDTGLKTPLFNLTSFALKGAFSDSENFKFATQQFQGYAVNKVTILSSLQSFYFVQIKNSLIVSLQQSTLLKCIKNYLLRKNLLENDNYLQVRSQIGSGKALRIFFNITYLLEEIKNSDIKLYQSVKALSVLSIAGADLDIEKDSVTINAFYSTKIQDKILNKLFLSTPQRVRVLNVLPSATSTFATVTFENFQDVWEYFKRILVITGQQEKQKDLVLNQKRLENLLGISLEEFLFSWLNDEITVASVSKFDASVLLISIKSEKEMEKVIDKLQKKEILTEFAAEDYKGKKIKQIKLASFFKFLSEVISPDLELPYYILYDEYLILCRDKECLKTIIDSIDKGDVLIYKDKVKRLYSDIDKGNVISYWNLSYGRIKLLQADNMFSRIIKNYNYGMLSMEFTDNGIKNRIVISEAKAGGIELVEGWPVKFDATIWSAPVFYNVDNKNLDEVIIGTEDGKVHIYDSFGESFKDWPVKMDKDLRTSPFVIQDSSKGLCLGAVSSSGKIYAWNKDGYLLEKFPIVLDAEVKTAPLILDINKDNKAEIIVSTAKGSIYAVNLDGQLLGGFPVQLPESVEADLQIIDINNDGHLDILCSSHSGNGDIYYINNKGEILEDKSIASGAVNFTSPVISNLASGQVITLVTRDGLLFQWQLNGDFVSGFPIDLDNKFLNTPVVYDITGDGHKEIILISADGKLLIIKANGEIALEKELNFKPIQNMTIILADVNKDNKKEICIPDTEDFLRFYDASGSLIFKLEGSISPAIKDIDKDGRLEVLTACDDGNVYLYKLP